jgi:histidinol-phosphate aminotransferase
MFLVDEAYYEYAQTNAKYQSALKLIRQDKDNVVITRTFSKIYGIAGMHIGYGIATSSTAKKSAPLLQVIPFNSRSSRCKCIVKRSRFL